MDGQTTSENLSGNVQIKQSIQICNVTIMFFVESDEDAMKIKRRLTESLVDVPTARVQFSMTNAPKRPGQDMTI